MTDRLFVFGCSFTKFHWPTYADILAKDHKKFYNWGRSGAGNFFIFNSIVECNKRNTITADDTVYVMWSSIAREDRFVKNKWLLSGSIYSQHIYDQEFVTKFSDPTGYLLRDLSLISAAKALLDNIGCKYYFFSIVPFDCYEDMFERWFNIDYKILSLYKTELAVIKPSVYQAVFNQDWHSRPGYRDLKNLEKNYYECAGPDWPNTWQEFLTLYETNQIGPFEEEILDQYFFRKKLIRTDYHPTPLEHLEYLQKVLPEVSHSDQTLQWVSDMDADVIAQKKCQWAKGELVERF